MLEFIPREGEAVGERALTIGSQGGNRENWIIASGLRDELFLVISRTIDTVFVHSLFSICIRFYMGDC